ncbi:hypothetical protein [Amycolatopsis sp. 3B14]|uniref:hypothetical protein n=1 Tax=Amycolatopsis sp. 3B14 TaxID=3243600 RepID=UPI003D99838A
MIVAGLADTASAMVAARWTPVATRPSARSRVRFHTVVGWPWLCSVSAMARPMGPRRERIDEAVAGLLAARARLDAIIAATAPAVADDPEACTAAVAAR